MSAPSGTTRFLYDGDALVAEYNSAGTLTARYVHGAAAGVDDPMMWFESATFAGSVLRWLHADQQGSIVGVTATQNDDAPSLNAYDEYGIPEGTNTGRFQYTGQAWIAELGMYHYKARMYSPTLGRFLQTDPIGYEGGINLYGYVHNDPINGVDPSGNQECNTGSRLGTGGFAGGCKTLDGFQELKAAPTHKPRTYSDSDDIGGGGGGDDAEWTTWDFVKHYYSGEGESINLEDIGLDDDFRSHPDVQDKVNDFERLVFSKVTTEAIVKDRAITDVTGDSILPPSTLFSLGHQVLHQSGACGLNFCFFTFEIKDRFADPLDIGSELPGGTPYSINYRWSYGVPRRLGN